MQPSLSEDEKKQVYGDLAEAMIGALENGQLLEKDADESSKFILEKLDVLTTHDGLENFLKELSEKWKIYEKVYMQLKQTQIKHEDTQKIGEIQDKLNQLSS